MHILRGIRVLVLLHASVAWGELAVLHDVTVKSVDYAEAILDVTVEVTADEVATLEAWAPSIGGNPYLSAENLHQGINKVEVALSRNLNLDRATTVTNINVTVVGQNGERWKTSQAVRIFFPGPEPAANWLNGAQPGNTLADVTKFTIDRNLSTVGLWKKTAIRWGLPIDRLRVVGVRQIDADYKGIYFTFGIEVSPESAGRLLNTALAFVSDPGLVGIAASPSIEQNSPNIQVSSSGPGGFTVISEKIAGSQAEQNPRSIEISSVVPRNVTVLTEETARRIQAEGLDQEMLFTLLRYTPKPIEVRVQELYSETYQLLDVGRRFASDRAKQNIDLILELDPEFAPAYLELARFYMKTYGRGERDQAYERAERSVRIAQDLDPNSADVAILLGYILTQQARYDEAAREYEKAAKIGTENLWLHANWGLNLERQGENEAAIAKYQQLLGTPTAEARNTRPTDWVMDRLPALLVNTARANEAVAAYEVYFERMGTLAKIDPCRYMDLARIQATQIADADAALAAVDRAVGRSCSGGDTVSAVAYLLKWQEYVTTGNKDAAKKSLLRAKGRAPSDDELFYALATSDKTATLMGPIQAEGFNIDRESSEGINALAEAVLQGEKDRVERLIHAAANTNHLSSKYHATPLIFAFANGEIEIAKTLLENGANPKQKLPTGETVEQMLRNQGMGDLVDKLIGRTAI